MKRTKVRVQCAKCPWKVTTDPHDIPNGYCEVKHANLKNTIAEPGDTRGLFASSLRLMACHESNVPGKELPCVGWLANQLGPGNNLALRLAAIDGKYGEFRTVGEQHETFEDTLPGEREE